MSRGMRVTAATEMVKTPEKAALEALAQARRRKQGAREALEIAHDRYVAACMELGRAKRALQEVRSSCPS